MHKLKGDTLIEVALAIGIFSLVAITVVGVTSAATSKAQSALEITITREDLDSQAEALRFIHDSYISGSQGKTTEDNDYAKLWNKVAKYAVSVDPNDSDNPVLNYQATTCSEFYNGNSGHLNSDRTGGNPFIINIRQLGKLKDAAGHDNSDNIIIANNDLNKIFYEPATYPRIIYGKASIDDENDQDLHKQVTNGLDTIGRVEGIYIVAARGESQIVSGANNHVDMKNAYYDFYIRSCWMPPGADRASTISTVVRLYDPAVICYKDCTE